MNECDGCLGLIDNSCLLSYNYYCPCKKCIVKNICKKVCSERGNVFSKFSKEHPQLFKKNLEEREFKR